MPVLLFFNYFDELNDMVGCTFLYVIFFQIKISHICNGMKILTKHFFEKVCQIV